MDPYPHFIIEDALPQDLYDTLEKEWPEKQLLATDPHDAGVCHRLKADEMLKEDTVSQSWRDFTEYHTSINFFREVKNIFGDHIKHENPTLGARGWAKKSDMIWTDCQTVIHKPVSATTRTPHIDNPREIYAGLLYMPFADDTALGGDFQIYNSVDKVYAVDMKKGRQIFDENLGAVHTTVPYKPNTFVMFLNDSPKAIHGVTPRTNATRYRRSVNIIAEYSRQSGKKMYSINEL